MNYATNIAILNNNGVVENIIWGLIYQLDEFNKIADRAVVIGNKNIQIGDVYINGEWYRDGHQVDTKTIQERIEESEAILEMLSEGTEVTDND